MEMSVWWDHFLGKGRILNMNKYMRQRFHLTSFIVSSMELETHKTLGKYDWLKIWSYNSWLWWWFHRCGYMSKLIRRYTLNTRSLLCVNDTSINPFKIWESHSFHASKKGQTIRMIWKVQFVFVVAVTFLNFIIATSGVHTPYTWHLRNVRWVNKWPKSATYAAVHLSRVLHTLRRNYFIFYILYFLNLKCELDLRCFSDVVISRTEPRSL